MFLFNSFVHNASFLYPLSLPPVFRVQRKGALATNGLKHSGLLKNQSNYREEHLLCALSASSNCNLRSRRFIQWFDKPPRWNALRQQLNTFSCNYFANLSALDFERTLDTPLKPNSRLRLKLMCCAKACSAKYVQLRQERFIQQTEAGTGGVL